MTKREQNQPLQGVEKARPDSSSQEATETSAENPADDLPRTDPMILWSTWPGDEPIDGLMAQLKELS